MARRLAHTYTSARHGFSFDSVPSRNGYMTWEPATSPNTRPEDYGAILDCVYEMADQLSTSNGLAVERSILQVLHEEGWTILPSHRQLIQERLEA